MLKFVYVCFRHNLNTSTWCLITATSFQKVRGMQDWLGVARKKHRPDKQRKLCKEGQKPKEKSRKVKKSAIPGWCFELVRTFHFFCIMDCFKKHRKLCSWATCPVHLTCHMCKTATEWERYHYFILLENRKPGRRGIFVPWFEKQGTQTKAACHQYCSCESSGLQLLWNDLWKKLVRYYIQFYCLLYLCSVLYV